MTSTTSPERTYNPTAGSACVPPTYAADLDVLERCAADVIERATSLVSGLSDAQFNFKPSPVAWSVAQCLKHLVLTGSIAADSQADAIAKLRADGKRSEGPYSYRGLAAKMGSMLSGGVEPPVREK